MQNVMPPGRYRLTQKSYMPPEPGKMAAVLDEGAEVLYARKPGPHMVPLDEQAKINAGVIQIAQQVEKPPQPDEAPRAATTKQADPERESVDIPADWRDLSWPARKSLASKLTSEPVRSGSDAEAAILAEIERRKA